MLATYSKQASSYVCLFVLLRRPKVVMLVSCLATELQYLIIPDSKQQYLPLKYSKVEQIECISIRSKFPLLQEHLQSIRR
mmetsp:Transcript_31253/g.65444  ORF Transcript_31253/g.65444 Transcript_31253/m.65444 type:complete len:80 (-) Transcript_31253:246-485(-)